MMIETGSTNLITDVPGLGVGHAHDPRALSGVTVLLAERPAACALDVRGGGPGIRESDLLAPEATVEAVDALVLSGGSALGLGAADGVQRWLKRHGRGFAIGPARVPIVPGAILFDLLNGGDHDWERSPYPDLAERAAEAAAADFALGSVGAGCGATTATLKGGIGSASQKLADGSTVGALAAVNAVGSATIGATPHFWAAPFEIGAEFGGLGLPAPWPADALTPKLKGGPGQNTTLAVVATDAALTKTQLRRLAIMAQDGLARALYPVHTPLDGDVVFALSTGSRPLEDDVHGLVALGIAAANTLARAVARGVHAARAVSDSSMPVWADLRAQRMNPSQG